MMDPTLLKKLDRLTTFPTNDSYNNQPKTAAGIHVKPFATTASSSCDAFTGLYTTLQCLVTIICNLSRYVTPALQFGKQD